MRLTKILCLVALLSIAAPAWASMTGVWNGNFSASLPCFLEAKTLQFAGPITLWIFEPENSRQFTAKGTASAAFADIWTCETKGSEALPVGINGSVNGSAVEGVMLFPTGGAFRPAGSISGDTITLSGPSDNGGSITITLSRFDTSTPAGFRTAERYDGSYTFTADYSYRCKDIGKVAYSGPAFLLVSDTGRGVSGALWVSGFKRVFFPTATSNGECGAQDQGDIALEMLGTLSSDTSNTMTGYISIPEYVPMSASFDLRSFSGSGSPPGGSLTFTLTNNRPLPTPDIRRFESVPPSITKGEPTRLVWAAERADFVTLDNGIGRQPVVNSIEVRPATTTVYTLTATSAAGSTQRTITINVIVRPNVRLGESPKGFTQRAGEAGGTDSFTIVNAGEAPTSIQLAPSANFFALDPASFPLAAGATQRVTIRGLPQAAGAYAGTIRVTASGGGTTVTEVPVAMSVVASQPGGTVQPSTTSARVEISSSSGQNASGSVQFTNGGTAPLQGIAVADVPWLVPQPGVITIPPGQTVSVSYTIDFSKRPVSAPLGAVTGTISLRYEGGTPGGPILAADPPPSSAINVTLVHIAKPNVGPGIPPPLLPNELALFVAGLGNRPNATGDLLVANRLTTPLQSFALFISGAGGVATAAALPQLVANSSIELPGLMKNVLGATVSTGTAQLRGSDASRTSIAAIQSNTSLPAGTYSTALPVFRSDRSATFQGTIVLSGLQKSASTQTNLFVQETTGGGGNFKIEVLDADGRVITSTPSAAIGGFGFTEMNDSVPPNASAVRITNLSGIARLAAYALVTNSATGDGWLVTDPSAGSTTESTFIVPILSAGSSAQTVLYTTNRSNASANVTIDVQSTPPTPSRRRAAGRGSSTPPTIQEVASIAPLQTTATNLTATSGFVRISGPPGAVSAVARSVVTSGSSQFGSGLPAVSVSAALALGQSRRFSAIDDASAASRSAAVPATFRTGLELVETNNQNAVVRLTLQFSVSGGSLVTSSARVTKDYALAAGQFVMIPDLAQDLIGAANRAGLGDLRNATLDVEVVGGSGRVIPFVQSIDNGSGDMIVRIE